MSEGTGPDRFFDEMKVGDWFVTGGRTVTEADLVNFAGLSGDHNPLHTDAEFAKHGPFGQRIGHGCLTLSLATGLEYAVMVNSAGKLIAFYGMNNVKFLAPVFIGDTIHLEGTITELERKDGGRGVVTFHHEIKNQEARVVVSLDKRMMYRDRPAS
jgi:3-hydroxybutyryl-CoA dehydratase